VLASAGDNADLAIVPSAIEADFSDDRVLYIKKDSLVNASLYTDIYQYSTDPDMPLYQVAFSYVGESRGNYIQESSSANGRVFKWIAPENNTPQGDYEPIKKLISPKQNQMVNLGGIHHFSPFTVTSYEISFTQNDQNTFSSLDAGDDLGWGLRLDHKQEFLRGDTARQSLSAFAGWEYINRNFNPTERYRPVEFERDWNLVDQLQGGPLLVGPDSYENIIHAGMNLHLNNRIDAAYAIGYLDQNQNSSGIRHQLSTNIESDNFAASFHGSYLSSNQLLNNTTFLRHKTRIARKIGPINLGIAEETEKNRWTDASTDSLVNNSFIYQEYTLFAESHEESKNEFLLSYTHRTDWLPVNNRLTKSSVGRDITFKIGLLNLKNHTFTSGISYRNLKVTEDQASGLKNDENLLGRVKYTWRGWKGLLTSSTFYEIGSGQERSRHFSYLEVSPGQGVYQWTDYNDNGIKELDEFEIASFQDRANYIRIAIPSQNYISVFTTQVNQVINLNPGRIWKGEKGIKWLVAQFSDNMAWRVSRKTLSEDLLENLNPFYSRVSDTSLVNVGSSIRNTLSWRRSHPRFGIDYIYLGQKNKLLLTQGFDDREIYSHGIKGRWRILEEFTIINLVENGSQSYRSEFFAQKNYRIQYLEEDLTLNVQPSLRWEFDVGYQYQKKSQNNSSASASHKLGGEIRSLQAGRSRLSLAFNFTAVSYTGQPNTPLAYEMLEGLLPGNNFTWNFSYQTQIIAGLEMVFRYDGRKLPGSAFIHTGNIQARAAF
jgi:hypothetical protein